MFNLNKNATKTFKFVKSSWMPFFQLSLLFVVLSLVYQNCTTGFSVGSSDSNANSTNSNNNKNNTAESVCSSSSGIAKYFSCNYYFNQKVSQITLTSPQKNYSDHLINGLNSRGWGNGVFQIDFSIDVIESSLNDQKFQVDTTGNWTDTDAVSYIPAPPGNSTAGLKAHRAEVGTGEIVITWLLINQIENYMKFIKLMYMEAF